MRSRERARKVWPVNAIRYAIRTLSTADPDVNRQAGFHGDDAGDFPAADCRLQEVVFGVPEQGDVVDEVDHPYVCTVVSTRSLVIQPACVRVRYVAKVSAAATGCGWVDCARKGVEGAKGEATAKLGVQVHLEAVVVRVRLVFGEDDGIEARIGQAGGRLIRSVVYKVWQITLVRQVDVAIVVLMAGLIADIASGQHGPRAELALHANAVLVAYRQLVVAHIEASNAGSVDGLNR